MPSSFRMGYPIRVHSRRENKERHEHHQDPRHHDLILSSCCFLPVIPISRAWAKIPPGTFRSWRGGGLVQWCSSGTWSTWVHRWWDQCRFRSKVWKGAAGNLLGCFCWELLGASIVIHHIIWFVVLDIVVVAVSVLVLVIFGLFWLFWLLLIIWVYLSLLSFFLIVLIVCSYLLALLLKLTPCCYCYCIAFCFSYVIDVRGGTCTRYPGHVFSHTFAFAEATAL